MALSAVAFATGIGLMVLPELLPAAAPAADLFQIVGPVAAALGFVSIWEVTRGLRRANALSAIAVAGGSLLAGLAPPAIALAWVAAGVLALTAVLGRGLDASRYGGGWRSLLD